MYVYIYIHYIMFDMIIYDTIIVIICIYIYIYSCVYLDFIYIYIHIYTYILKYCIQAPSLRWNQECAIFKCSQLPNHINFGFDLNFCVCVCASISIHTM